MLGHGLSILCVMASAAGLGVIPAYGQSLSQSQSDALTGTCSSSIGPARGPQLAALCLTASGVANAPEGGSPTGPADQGGEDQERRTKQRLEYLRNLKSGNAIPQMSQFAQASGSGAMTDASGSGGMFDIGPLSGFVNFEYQNVSRHTTYFTNGFNSDRYGGVVGVDHSFDNIVLGATFEYYHTDADFKSSSGNFNTDSYGGSLYGSVSPQPNMFIDASIGYTHMDTTINRGVTFALVGAALAPLGNASGNPSSNQYRANISGGYDFVHGNITFGPRVGWAYSRNKVDAFRETGSTGLELAFGEQTYESLTSSVGGRATIAISTSFGVIVPQLSADYIHEFKDNQQTFTAHFVQDLNAAPTNLVFQTDEPDRNYYALGIGVVLGLPHGLSSFVNYRALVGDALKTTQTVTAGVRMEF
jgi:outer membrane autotransporter protein